MTTTTFLAYFLMICYLIIERLLRKGQKARSFRAGVSDRGSSQIMYFYMSFSAVLMLLAPVLNVYKIGSWNIVYVGWLGLLIMVVGLSIRYWAAKTLGKFYTRTLRVIEGQKIIDQAPYNIIRHPGYLGVFMIGIGASLAVGNWYVLLAIVIIGIISFVYRINAEEKMLKSRFGEEYKIYRKKTWKLIPLIY